MVRIGLVGAGFIGTVHSWALWALARAEMIDARVAVVCDLDADKAEALAGPHEAEVSTDPEATLERVDAVYVCTPTAAHRELVEAAAARGLPVFCEKPLAQSYPECEAVAAALERVPHQVGLVLRQAPVFREIATRLTDGRHGRVLAVVLRDDQFFPIQGRYASTWRSDAAVAGGGTLIEHSIHDLDLFRWFCGDPETVACRTASFFGHEGVDDLASVTLAYPDGRVASLTSVWHQVLSRTSTRRLEVFCEDAVLWTEDDHTGPLHVQTSDGTDAVECPPPGWVDELPVPEDVRRPLGQYAEADKLFCDRLTGTGRAGTAEDERGPDAATALAAHRLVADAYRSAAALGAAVSPDQPRGAGVSPDQPGGAGVSRA